jgi:uncharacterized protein YebE (UPF0316 family)
MAILGFLQTLPVLWLAVCIFGLRVVDVSLDTIRLLAIVQGRIATAVCVGFFEVLIWISVASQVIVRIRESPIVAVAFAAGFAVGNAVGIALEKRLPFGQVMLRLVTANGGQTVIEVLSRAAQHVTAFRGDGADGPVTLIYAVCPRRKLSEVLRAAKAIDPQVVHLIERANLSSFDQREVLQANGWRTEWRRT